MNGEVYRCGEVVAESVFARIRREMVLEHCKWDPQVGDEATLARFPLIMRRATWRALAAWAEALSAEAASAERELSARPELQRRLGLPGRLRSALSTHRTSAPRTSAPRAFRYDFHFTSEGWRISECNADVPGGYAESSAFPRLMAEQFSGFRAAGDPGGAWALAIARAAHSPDVALLAAAGFLEDAQVIHYLAARLREQGLRPYCLQPEQISWRDELAFFGQVRLGAVVRFYQAEWLARLSRSTNWQSYLRSPRTPVSNPGTCIALESKRFPLVWNALRDSALDTWRTLLPETRDPRDADWQRDDSWLLKTAICNTGDTVSVRALLGAKKWASVARSARWFPSGWVAQRRFEPIPLQSPLGAVFPCVGVYTIDGRAAGAYARLSRGPIVDFSAVDVALLIEEDADDVARA